MVDLNDSEQLAFDLLLAMRKTKDIQRFLPGAIDANPFQRDTLNRDELGLPGSGCAHHGKTPHEFDLLSAREV